MKISNLDTIPEVDDLAILVEEFKKILFMIAAGGGVSQNDEMEYQRVRKLVLGNPFIKDIVPKFLLNCRNCSEFSQFINEESPTYEERIKYLASVINPLMDKIEYEEGIGSLEFSRIYEERKIIGQGGFGQVYLVEHKLLKLPFAVKVFAPAFYEGGNKELERFFQEARILFNLDHPNIIKIYDAGLIGKRPFIRMEYFNGKNLNEVLTHDGILKPKDALILMKNIVEALVHAHNKGVIHRDLKPSNIMVSKPQKSKIIDFGLGIYIENELYSRITRTGEKIISGYYNAPELIKNPKLIDKRTDIYSIGAIWFNMLTGQPPAGTTISQQLTAINELDKNSIIAIEKCLADLSERYESCEQLLLDIKRIEEN